MHGGAAHGHDHGHDDHHHDSGQMTVLGFWLYLMTDCILFASLFATYAVPVSYTHLTLPTTPYV